MIGRIPRLTRYKKRRLGKLVFLDVEELGRMLLRGAAMAADRGQARSTHARARTAANA